MMAAPAKAVTAAVTTAAAAATATAATLAGSSAVSAAATSDAAKTSSKSEKKYEKMIKTLMEFGPSTGSPMMPTKNPFIFCVYHEDDYPAGNGKFGPKGRIPSGAREFYNPSMKWKMYHGDDVPGFPHHPHRGFETITIVMKGVVDHADSLGSSGRYANGDVQWMTAGSGVNHAEMFPLIRTDEENHMKLFQIWLRLPHKSMTVPPAYTMLWNEDIPIVSQEKGSSRAKIIAGSIDDVKAPKPTPNSWAINGGDVRLFLIEVDPGSRFKLPAAKSPNANTTLWLYDSTSPSEIYLSHVVSGSGDDSCSDDSKSSIAGVKEEKIPYNYGAEVNIPSDGLIITNKDETKTAKILLLEGNPIDEPVVSHGPFVAKTQTEIRNAFAEYQRTQFGGWPWDQNGPVWGDKKRFAYYADGKKEERDLKW